MEICAAMIRLPLQYIIELAHRVLLHGWQDMAVDVHRHADLVVTQSDTEKEE
jgi:hypothetical protein